jgi:hypothetical protein
LYNSVSEVPIERFGRGFDKMLNQSSREVRIKVVEARKENHFMAPSGNCSLIVLLDQNFTGNAAS